LTPRGEPPENKAFEELLVYLREARGFDFTGYKRASLNRRVSKRMDDVGIKDYPEYMDYLEVHPDEFELLFNTILINVTSFFRDPEGWDYVARHVVPEVDLSTKGGPIRVWSAGCASGEEAYTLAIVLAEHLGLEGFTKRVKIYATDVDEEALLTARQASYTSKEVEPVSEGLREKYFEQAGSRYLFKRELRRSVIFGRHDVLQDAPISKIDLLACRNVIMYFNADTQSKIVANLHFALKDAGFLFLGHAEMMLTHTDLFEPADLKNRVFRRASAAIPLRVVAQVPAPGGILAPQDEATLRTAAFDSSPTGQIALDPSGNVLLVNEAARKMFQLARDVIGRPFHDLEVSYRPVELRSRIEEVVATRHPIDLPDVERILTDGTVQNLYVRIAPVPETDDDPLGVIIRFEDVTQFTRLQADFVRSNQELETAYEELQSTNEELETTNEELQSTVEELETTNEELQSTNEELETMNEELQSTNAELQTVNDELHIASSEFDSVNRFLGSVLTSLQTGVAVLDHNFGVLSWNRRAYELWGVREEEVKGSSFINLDIGLPVAQMITAARRCLNGSSPREELTLVAVNRRGKPIKCHVTCTPLTGSSDSVHGVVVMMEELDEEGSTEAR